ncbi:MAG: AraC family transcriptional regulator ligand-binding domain-containing protein [Geminicoccaceae bacterium]
MGPLPRLVLEGAGERRLLDLLRQASLPAAVLDEPRLRIPLLDMVTLFSLSARSLGDAALGLRVGDQMAATDYGGFVRYSLAAPTLGRAVARLVRSVAHYQQDGCLFVEPAGLLLRVGYRTPVHAAPFARHHADHVLQPMIDFARAYLGPAWRPAAIEVPYACDDHRHALDRHFGVPVRWSRPGVALLLPRDALAATHARPALPALSPGELRDLARRPRRPRMRDLVAEIVALRLHDGRTDLDGVAARLGLHRRGLQRALAEEGVTYRQVVQGVARAVAEHELLAGDRPIAELALALGFSEPQHFTRAYRRWTGVAPSSRRAIGRRPS